MKTEKIVKIGKEIIYISGFYRNYSLENKEKIRQKLLFYKKELDGSQNIYSKKLIHFIDDLLNDLSKNIPLQIDSLFEDDFIGNYYNSLKQVKIYNSLVNLDIYKNILKNNILLNDSNDILKIKKEKNNILIDEFYNNFKQNFLKLNIKDISNLLLIFTIFDLISPKKYLSRLFDFRKKYGFSYESIQKIIKMIKIYEKFLDNLYNISIKNLKNKNISYKYIKITKDGEEKDFELNFSLKDSSFHNFRTGDYLYEYKILLKNLKK